MELDDFVHSLKPFTKVYMCCSLAVGLVLTLKLFSPYTFVLLVPKDLWNPFKYIFSIFFLQRISFNSIMDLIFFYFTNNSLEETFLPRRYGDYIYMLMFILLGNYLLIIPFSWNNYIIMRKALNLSLIYIYCKKNPNAKFAIFFILRVKAQYFIWFYFLMTVIEDRWIIAVSSLIVGHMYIYLKEILPVAKRVYWLDTPRFVNIISDKFLELMGEKNE